MNKHIRFLASSVCSPLRTAVTGGAVGSKVVNVVAFLSALRTAVAAFKPAAGSFKGHLFVPLPAEALQYVSCGSGVRTGNPADYVSREWRGKTQDFLRREHAEATGVCNVVVYTRTAYMADPDIKGRASLEERRRVRASKCSHVVVAVLASAQANEPITPDRARSNRAGGNAEWLPGVMSEEVYQARLGEAEAYWSVRCVVAD